MAKTVTHGSTLSSSDRLSLGKLAASAVVDPPGVSDRPVNSPLCIGVLPGEGIGPELLEATLEVLEAVRAVHGDLEFDIHQGGAIGRVSESICGQPLSEDVCTFCRDVFERRGSIICGPGGGRFVYDLRRRFDLYCKFSPVQVTTVQARMGRLQADHVAGTDLLLVRENVGGLYHGQSTRRHHDALGRVIEHTFSYEEHRCARIATAAARMAKQRRGHLTCVIKQGALPELSELWSEVTRQAAEGAAVQWSTIDIDYAAYRLLQEPEAFDVVLAPNLFGDILIDVSAVLLGSRGAAYSGNFGPAGEAVYQTNHGAAYDLAGTDRANPVGQFLSLAMALRESFGLTQPAQWIEEAVARVWADGWCTEDMAGPSSHVVGTRAFTERVSTEIRRAEMS